jgi:type I site-specific restriction endonuclease
MGAKIMRRRIMAFVLATIVLGACADASTDESVPADTSSDTAAASTVSADGQEEALGQFEDEIDSLSEAIASSESAQELSSAWDALKVELTATVATLRAGGAAARDDVDAALDTFEQELDALDIEENVSAAWDELRSHVEQLMS